MRWIAGTFLVLAVLVALVIAFFDWNLLREPIARRVSSATGRSFAINGDLKVHLSLQPRIVAHDVVLGNAAWSSGPVMAEVKRIDFRIDVLELLAGRVHLPELTVSQPRIALEVSRSGAVNWAFKDQAPAKPVLFPAIGMLAIDGGTASYRDPVRNTDLALELRTLGGDANASVFGLELTGKGRFKGQPSTVIARGGALLNLRDAQHPYPIEAKGTVGTTHFSIDGKLFDPLHFKGEQLNFRIAGSDLALLFPIIGVPLPPTASYRFAGFLDHTGDLWAFRRFKGTLGESDLAGDFSVDRGAKPQKLVATLVSRSLVLKDLAGFIGAKRDDPLGRAPRTKLLPAEPFRLDKLMAADVDVRFRGEKIVTANLPLDKMSAHLIVNGGVVKLAPLDFGLAGGNLVSVIEMDGRQPRMVTRADITAKGLRVGQLFPTSRLGAGGTGTMGGRATLKGHGNSVGQMLATADGDAALIMEGGSVGELALRMSNLDLANSLLLMLGGDRQVPVRCMVGVFNAVEGDFKVKSLVLDTAKVKMTGSGNVDFTDESLHLRLVSQSKGFSLASLRGPIGVSGSFVAPVLKPELQGATLRGGLAVALGLATGGLGALIPLLDFGTGKDSNCAALMSEARAETGVKASDMQPR
ncbi:MAG: AsmA family protein [Ramlibacter sp.]|nr:AsmA family protein [Ramlibacter sp.]